MTTRADDLRAAARHADSAGMVDFATRLRQHADTIQRIEREMREQFDCPSPSDVEEWAAALRGDTT